MTTPVSAAASTQPKKSHDYRPDIDGLRAIAVLAVLGYHAFPSRVKGGFVGVDVFFVISGFLITGILIKGLDRGSFRFQDFYSRRIRRIFPALFVLLIACYLIGWFILLPIPYMQLGKHIAAGAGFVSNLTLWREAGYFDPAASTKPLLHLWSLGIEEQFYIVWPLLLWAMWKTRFNVIILVGALAIFSFALNVNRVHSDAVAAFYSPFTRWWELMIGSCLARISARPTDASWFPRASYKLRNLQSALGLACICAAILLIKTESLFPGWWALLPTLGTLFVISAGPSAWLNRILLSHPIMVGVGLISYPLYLWHWPLFFFARQIGPASSSLATRVIVLSLSFVLAWLTYLLVERRFRFGRPGRKVLVACAGMAVIGAAGWITYSQAGLAFRYPAVLRGLLTYSYDRSAGARVHECWVTEEAFASSCVDRSDKANTVVLWGDSHAGGLYPGLKNVAQNQMAISEFARDACPPIVAVGTSICVRSNAYVLERIQELHPKIVIMFAYWVNYRTGLDLNADTSKNLGPTLDELRKRGVQNIVIIGPAPNWNEPLPILLSKRTMEDAPLYRVPDRMSFGLDPTTMKVDESLRAMLNNQPSVHYVSLVERLCDANGCLTRVPNSSGAQLMAWDESHLTKLGAELVARYLFEQGIF